MFTNRCKYLLPETLKGILTITHENFKINHHYLATDPNILKSTNLCPVINALVLYSIWKRPRCNPIYHSSKTFLTITHENFKIYKINCHFNTSLFDLQET